jgi:exopolysaccharide biosynthesis WecB/TagA/CpsF family protein
MNFPKLTMASSTASIQKDGRLRPIYVVDGQPIHVSTLEETCCLIIGRAATSRSFYICTLNLDHLVKLRADMTFRRVYAEADIVTADGFPIVLLAAIDRVALGRVTGADLVMPLCEAAAANDLPVFFIAPTKKALDLCSARLLELIPNLRIAGQAVPPVGFDPYSEEAKALIQSVSASKAKICFVALGAPKQEILSALASAQTQGTAFIPVGAALEFIAGTKRRAPAWLRSAGFEWSWRLVTEPRRLFKRYVKSAILLAGLLLSRRRSAAANPDFTKLR